MPTPYSSGPHILEAEGGGESIIEIRAPHRGVITAIKLEQIAGTDDTCDIEIFTSRLAAPPGSSQSSESLNESVQGPRSNYTVFGTKQMLSGLPLNEFELNYSYTNKDGTPTNPERKLYVALRPGGTGVKQYGLTLEMLTSLLT